MKNRIIIALGLIGGGLLGRGLVACSATQAEKTALEQDAAILARDGAQLALARCASYEASPKRDKTTDDLCLALELAVKAAQNQRSIVPAVDAGQ